MNYDWRGVWGRSAGSALKLNSIGINKKMFQAQGLKFPAEPIIGDWIIDHFPKWRPTSNTQLSSPPPPQKKLNLDLNRAWKTSFDRQTRPIHQLRPLHLCLRVRVRVRLRLQLVSPFVGFATIGIPQWRRGQSPHLHSMINNRYSNTARDKQSPRKIPIRKDYLYLVPNERCHVDAMSMAFASLTQNVRWINDRIMEIPLSC